MTSCCRTSARARAWRRAATSSSTSTRTTPRDRSASRCGPGAPGSRQFVDAAVAAGIPMGDYNGRDRGGADGVVSLLQTTTRDGKRASTYHAFLEGEAEERANLDVICGRTRPRSSSRTAPTGCGPPASSTAPRRASRRSSTPRRTSWSAPARSGLRSSCCCRGSARRTSSSRSGSPAGTTRPTSASISRTIFSSRSCSPPPASASR